MKKFTAFILAILLLLALCACSRNSAYYDSELKSESAVMDYAEDSVADAVAPSTAPSNKGSYGIEAEEQNSITTADSSIYSDPDAKIIRTADLTIQTLEFDKAVTDLAALTEAKGGYYETANVDSGSYYNQSASRSAYYVVRIPKENFVAFRDAVSSVGHIFSFTEDARNVGEEYYDTEARLETLTTKRERLLALLDKAEIMEDIISLENALADVQYEIDLYTSTLRKYDSLIDYSTFTIRLNEVVKIEEEPSVQEGFGTKLLANLKNGFSDFTDSLQSFAFWFARNIITLVILAVIIFAAVKIIIYTRKKRYNRMTDRES